MSKRSAGLLMYRLRPGGPELLLVHPGGPFWAAKDKGAWSIPKGEIEEGEDPIAAALREFEEETGMRPSGDFRPLKPVVLKSRKTVYAWAFEGEFDPAGLVSSTFTMEWPPHSGKEQEFPEVDRAAWFSLASAGEKVQGGQLPFINELAAMLL
jgi:predicted NUDIX family NTP pyrophosphohydrolase